WATSVVTTCGPVTVSAPFSCTSSATRWDWPTFPTTPRSCSPVPSRTARTPTAAATCAACISSGRRTAARTSVPSSGDDSVLEALHADPGEQGAEADESAVDREQRHVRDVADQRGTETLGHVDDRVDEYEDLQ